MVRTSFIIAHCCGFICTLLSRLIEDCACAGSNPRTTNEPVVKALRDRGLTVVPAADGCVQSLEKLLAAADREPESVIDDGAELLMLIGMHRSERVKWFKAVSAEAAAGTTTETTRLHTLEKAGKSAFPAMAANLARCK